MNDKIETKQFFKGAFILTLAGLFSKILSAGYRIPLQNITGDLGFYIYQQVYPFLGIAIMLSLYGFPVAVSKMVADFNDQQRELSLRSFILPVFGIILLLSVLLFLLLFTQAYRIAELMGDQALSVPIRASAYVFLVLPFTSLFRGIFQGTGDMKPTAVSQVLEQLVRVSIIIIVAVLLLQQSDFYAIGTGAAIASVVGSVVAAIFLGAVLIKRRFWSRNLHRDLPYRYFIKTVFLYGLFISVNYMFLLLIQMADAFTLVPSLESYGFTPHEAKVMKGVFDRGQPLIQLGIVLGSSLALALIPTITKQRLEQQPDKFHNHLHSALKLSLFLAAGATVGLIMIFPYVNKLLYQNNQGEAYLRILMLVILFSSIAITTSSVLQGVDAVYQTAGVILAGAAVKWYGNLLLVPYFGLHGAAWASVSGAVVVLAWNIWLMRRRFRPVVWRKLPFLKVFLALAGMTAFLLFISMLESFWLPIESRGVLLLFTLTVAGAGGMVYFMVLIRLGVFSKDELEQIPSGELLDKWFSRRKYQ
ncbi:putative polysaccharide biosynthesis protein [Thalassobacillus devorans]|uniref:putative polysaccharide biosynthesis protein n=1 Tax=Thalassobacillus devorans TaxID=279813 RepID=UPI00048E3498|nr:polysaccharide biosynthesis protein [Thalassobacillus devorans]